MLIQNVREQERMIRNSVATKAITSIDLADFYPAEEDCAYLDIKDFLFKGLILREADFRETIKNTDWEAYKNKNVGLYCSADAIIPMWAYMVLASELSSKAKVVLFGKKDDFPLAFLHHNLEQISTADFDGKRLVIKGCGDKPIDEKAFTIISRKLAPVARSIMYGEPCSSVAVYKKSVD